MERERETNIDTEVMENRDSRRVKISARSVTSDPRGSRRIMPYCNYNKGYLVGISRLQAHSVIRVIEMVSEEGETVLLVPWPSRRRWKRERKRMLHRDIREDDACVCFLDVDEPEIMWAIRYRDIVYLTGPWNLKKIDSPIL